MRFQKLFFENMFVGWSDSDRTRLLQESELAQPKAWSIPCIGVRESMTTDVGYQKALSALTESTESLQAAAHFVELGSVCMAYGEDAQAAAHYRHAAAKGNCDGMRNLGLCYAKGRGVPKDLKQAFNHFMLAAQQGSAQAQIFVGLCFAKGSGIDKSPEEAVKWFRKGAEQGNKEAQMYLGGCFERGVGVSRDIDSAVFWYTKGSAQNDPRCAFRLGGLLEKCDREKSIYYYTLAAELRVGGAIDRLKILMNNKGNSEMMNNATEASEVVVVSNAVFPARSKEAMGPSENSLDGKTTVERMAKREDAEEAAGAMHDEATLASANAVLETDVMCNCGDLDDELANELEETTFCKPEESRLRLLRAVMVIQRFINRMHRKTRHKSATNVSEHNLDEAELLEVGGHIAESNVPFSASAVTDADSSVDSLTEKISYEQGDLEDMTGQSICNIVVGGAQGYDDECMWTENSQFIYGQDDTLEITNIGEEKSDTNIDNEERDRSLSFEFLSMELDNLMNNLREKSNNLPTISPEKPLKKVIGRKNVQKERKNQSERGATLKQEFLRTPGRVPRSASRGIEALRDSTNRECDSAVECCKLYTPPPSKKRERHRKGKGRVESGPHSSVGAANSTTVQKSVMGTKSKFSRVPRYAPHNYKFQSVASAYGINQGKSRGSNEQVGRDGISLQSAHSAHKSSFDVHCRDFCGQVDFPSSDEEEEEEETGHAEEVDVTLPVLENRLDVAADIKNSASLECNESPTSIMDFNNLQGGSTPNSPETNACTIQGAVRFSKDEITKRILDIMEQQFAQDNPSGTADSPTKLRISESEFDIGHRKNKSDRLDRAQAKNRLYSGVTPEYRRKVALRRLQERAAAERSKCW